MKRAFLLFLLFLVHAAHADEPDSPSLHYFVVPSPSNACFAVHSVQPWQDVGDITKYGRLQLCRSDTGAELWRIEGILCYGDEVFPADNCKHLAIVRSQFRSSGADTLPVISFYSEGKLLTSHTLKELGFDVSKLRTSVSHASFISVQRAERDWQWEWPLGTENARIATTIVEPNPRWEGAVFIVEALDGQTFRFDSTTGKRLQATGTP